MPLSQAGNWQGETTPAGCNRQPPQLVRWIAAPPRPTDRRVLLPSALAELAENVDEAFSLECGFDHVSVGPRFQPLPPMVLLFPGSYQDHR